MVGSHVVNEITFELITTDSNENYIQIIIVDYATSAS